MRQRKEPLFFLFVLLFFALCSPELGAEERVHHEIKVILQPEGRVLIVEDAITLPNALFGKGEGKVRFLLHDGLRPASETPGVKITEEKRKPRPSDFGLKGDLLPADVPLGFYTATLTTGVNRFVLRYRGEIHHPLKEEGERYARSFQETPGTISPDGVFLAGVSFWVPWFNSDLITFNLDVTLPKPWIAVSQGERTRSEEEGRVTHIRWESPEPQEEIYLVANRWTEYRRTAGNVETAAFLKTPEKELADKYLEVTGQYLSMYHKLLGPFPYKKFALVENFWETGYGMPSFTLLGSGVMRLPFILHSSYPHEILHDWWGNGVYVDSLSGNWSEGLTAYLADHLISEQRGEGAEARRATLQKYAHYVSEKKDFPLTQFRGRHSAATEAVGYGKTLMLFHMLRLQLGDDLFIEGLRRFYRENRFRRASFADLERAFADASGKEEEIRPLFSQWVHRTGAPALRVKQVKVQEEKGGSRLTAVLEQQQPGPPYLLRVPLSVALENQEKAYQTTVWMTGKTLDLSLLLPDSPLRLEIDPEFDLFRRLNRNETPPSLAQAFGAEKALVVLPDAVPEALREGYIQLAEGWKESQSTEIEIKWDRELEELPSDRAVWLFGWENRFRPKVIAQLSEYDFSMTSATLRLGRSDIPRRNHAVVLSARLPGNPDLALTWLAADSAKALPGLGRKLPHYGRYSYLGFEGEEPANVVKGAWPVVHSPMSVKIADHERRGAIEVKAKLAPRLPLATLPPLFSGERMAQDVRLLADPSFQGRGLGSPELDRAAEFIAAEFKKAGLKPGGDSDGSYFQVWNASVGDPAREVALKNVIGVLPGRKGEWAGQSVVVGAHYDHLGLGRLSTHEGDQGKLHPGADDNASGVAVLLELARLFGQERLPERSIVFAAFSGEEAGLLGSKHYVAHEKRFPADKAIGMLNMDTVGRLGTNKLMVLGTGSAREWIHIFRGAGFVTGVPIEPVAAEIGSSDQRSFLDAGVPAVQFFSGPNLDFHRPTDTPDKIDPSGLVKVASVMKEAVEYLSGRPEPLTAQISAGVPPTDSSKRPAGERAGLGTVPDFAYAGKGVRLVAIVPGSPIEKAGLQAGDVIVRMNSTDVGDLRHYSDLLKAVAPGDTVSLTFLREGIERQVEVEAAAR